MPVKNLSLSAQQVGDALGVCPTSASRKIAEAEQFITGVALTAAALTKTRRPDRVRTSIAQPLRTVAALITKHPDQLEPWLARLMD